MRKKLLSLEEVMIKQLEEFARIKNLAFIACAFGSGGVTINNSHCV